MFRLTMTTETKSLMKRTFIIAALALMASVSALVMPASAKPAQDKSADRIATRDRLRRLLEVAGQEKGINIPFRQGDKQPFNFIGVKRDGLTNSDLFEIVISVSDQQTIHFRIYPHYHDGYINIDKVKNSPGLMRLLLNFSINIPFRQSDKQPFNFIGVKRDGLTNSDLFEIVISVSDQQTIS